MQTHNMAHAEAIRDLELIVNAGCGTRGDTETLTRTICLMRILQTKENAEFMGKGSISITDAIQVFGLQSSNGGRESRAADSKE